MVVRAAISMRPLPRVKAGRGEVMGGGVVGEGDAAAGGGAVSGVWVVEEEDMVVGTDEVEGRVCVWGGLGFGRGDDGSEWEGVRSMISRGCCRGLGEGA